MGSRAFDAATRTVTTLETRTLEQQPSQLAIFPTLAWLEQVG